MEKFKSYEAAKAAGMVFAGRGRDGHIVGTRQARELIDWLINRSFTPFEATLCVENFRL